MEDACLSDGFKILLENSSGSELEYPVAEVDREAGQAVTGTRDFLDFMHWPKLDL